MNYTTEDKENKNVNLATFIIIMTFLILTTVLTVLTN